VKIVLIVHDIRSCHNVGSLLRTAEGLGLTQVYLGGYTPYPEHTADERLPHIRQKIDRQIHKTALGAEQSQPWSRYDDVQSLLRGLRADGYLLVALEQSADSMPLHEFQPTSDVALLVGREVEGIDPALFAQMDTVLEIPMAGRKESFNVVQATAMALYQCRFFAKS
jgi:tRNA G18 (ribose-2'-O)-methylase SpoU